MVARLVPGLKPSVRLQEGGFWIICACSGEQLCLWFRRFPHFNSKRSSTTQNKCTTRQPPSLTTASVLLGWSYSLALNIHVYYCCLLLLSALHGVWGPCPAPGASVFCINAHLLMCQHQINGSLRFLAKLRTHPRWFLMRLCRRFFTVYGENCSCRDQFLLRVEYNPGRCVKNTPVFPKPTPRPWSLPPGIQILISI